MTQRESLKEALSPEVFNKAVVNAAHQDNDLSRPARAAAYLDLARVFVWRKTPEGHHFWSDVCISLRKREESKQTAED